MFQANDLANRVAKKVEKAHQTIVDGAARVAAKIIERAESIIALVPAYKDPGDTTAKFIETRKYRDGLELLKGVLELSERITGRVPRPGQQRPGDDDMGGDGPGHDAPAPAAVREAEFLDELIGHGTGNNADRGTSQLDAGDDAPAGQPGGGNGDGPA